MHDFIIPIAFIAKYNRDIVVRMTEALPPKITLANENGLNSVL